MGTSGRTDLAGGNAPLYVQLAAALEAQIDGGVLRAGDRVPSVRKLSHQHSVSLSTALQAYLWLENRGRIEARPRSGFYVRAVPANQPPEPDFERPKTAPSEIEGESLLSEVIRSVRNPSNLPLAAACPSAELLPYQQLNRMLASEARRVPTHSMRYEFVLGLETLRRQIARRSPDSGCSFSPGELVITCGAMEALNLSLRAVARPDDVIAIESPTYFGILQAIDSLGMRAIEIPTHPRTGIDLALLERAIRKHRVKACVVMTNCQNPLGFVLSEDRKKALVDLTARHNIALIEDDVYGDLAFGARRATAAKAFDRKGGVLLCGSFSKVLAPGFRIGWVHGGRYHREVERLKFVTTLASPSLQQLAIARFLESGGYDRHLRRLRTTFSSHVRIFSQAIAKYFPDGTCVSRPDGGYVLWLELPGKQTGMRMYRRALAEKISVLPGVIFSPSGRFPNCIRLSCGCVWSDEIDRALLKLGRIAGETP